MNKIKQYGIVGILATTLVITGCEKETVAPPPVENETEVITDVKLIFTNANNPGDVVEALAQDPDGEGVKELEIIDAITLDTSKTYTLTFEILNALDSNDVEDIGEEIKEEDDEHQIFFSFTADAFANPAGNGNFDNFADPVNYNDNDDNGLPVGLNTTWTTPSSATSGGSFRVKLAHQPDGIKSPGSTVNDGDTDFDLDFVLNIQ